MLATPQGRPLSRALSFSLPSGHIVLIEGPNGSGKTTLLRALTGTGRPAAGTVTWHVRIDSIGYLPQLQSNDFHLPSTLEDVVRTGVSRRLLPEEIVSNLLPVDKLKLRWSTASGGERKRTLLQRALLQKKRVLLLDEPLNHLDKESRACVARALVDFAREPGQGIVLVSHEGHEASALAEVPRVVVRLGDSRGRDA